MKKVIELIKKSFIFKKIYIPIAYAHTIKSLKERRQIFQQEGKSILEKFAECMNSTHLTYWLEFGTLLGAYRDGKFIPHDLDIDVGAHLEDANIIYHTLTKNGFKLVREFHVVGENGLEQTYESHGATIDVMYFYKKDDKLWCNGAVFPRRRNWNKIVKTQVTAHWFKPFDIAYIDFMGINCPIPDNVEEHLIEIFGLGYKIYDPNFSGDLNKKTYPIEEKWGVGFVFY